MLAKSRLAKISAVVQHGERVSDQAMLLFHNSNIQQHILSWILISAPNDATPNFHLANSWSSTCSLACSRALVAANCSVCWW